MKWFSNYIVDKIQTWYKNLGKSEILSDVKPELSELIKDETKKSVDNVSTSIYNELISKLKDSEAAKGSTIITLSPKKEPIKITETTHEMFETVLKVVNNDLPVYLVGPAGSGKNVICKQVAKALNLNFYFTNAVTQEYKLTGFIDANGTFHETEFYKAFKYGGLFFLDELDASIPEVLVILNAAIANRYFDFPNGKITAHENFRVIAAGNTFGTGADSVYTGRFQLDGASLDRFTVIRVNYSAKIEKSITNNNSELIQFCYSFRKAVSDTGASYIFSYRALVAITALETSFDIIKVLNMCLFKSMQKDDLHTIFQKIQENIGNRNNKYYLAMAKLI